MKKFIVVVALILALTTGMTGCQKPYNGSPVITGANDREGYVGEEIDLKKGVTAEDSQDGALGVNVTLLDKDGVPVSLANGVFTATEIAEYNIYYKAVNSAERESEEVKKLRIVDNKPVITLGAKNPETVNFGDTVTIATASAVESTISDTVVEVQRILLNSKNEDITSEMQGNNFTPGAMGSYTVRYTAANRFEKKTIVENTFVAVKAEPGKLLQGFEDGYSGWAAGPADADKVKLSVNDNMEYITSGAKSLKAEISGNGANLLVLSSGLNGGGEFNNYGSIVFSIYSETAQYVGCPNLNLSSTGWLEKSLLNGATVAGEWTSLEIDLSTIDLDADGEFLPRDDVYGFYLYLAPGEYYIDEVVYTEREHNTLISVAADAEEAFINEDYTIAAPVVKDWKDNNYEITYLVKKGSAVWKEASTYADGAKVRFDAAAEYTIEYTVTNSSGNTAICQYTVTALDPQAVPKITLSGSNPAKSVIGEDVSVAGATATFNGESAAVTVTVTKQGSQDNQLESGVFTPQTAGKYNIVYRCIEGSGATVTNTVIAYMEEPENVAQGFETLANTSGFGDVTGTATILDDVDYAASGTKSLKLNVTADCQAFFDCAAVLGTANLTDISKITMKVKGSTGASIWGSYIFAGSSWFSIPNDIVTGGAVNMDSWLTVTYDLDAIFAANPALTRNNVWALRMGLNAGTYYIDEIVMQVKEIGNDPKPEPGNVVQGFETVTNIKCDKSYEINTDMRFVNGGEKSLKVSEGTYIFEINGENALISNDLSAYTKLKIDIFTENGAYLDQEVFGNGVWIKQNIGSVIGGEWHTMTFDLSVITDRAAVYALRFYFGGTFYLDNICLE